MKDERHLSHHLVPYATKDLAASQKHTDASLTEPSRDILSYFIDFERWSLCTKLFETISLSEKQSYFGVALVTMRSTTAVETFAQRT